MQQENKPNIVFVITDDQGYGDLGCTGNPIISTPHIDSLFHESIRFTNYHVGPTCAPTRAGLMSGHYHNSTGVWHTIGGRSLMRKNEPCLASILRENGYRTGIFGKWHLGDNYPYRPQDRGFEETVIHGGGGIGQTPDYWGNDYFDDTYFVNGQPQKFEGYCTDVFFDMGLDFLQRHQDEPFFCFIATNAPHRPLRVDEKYAKMYQGLADETRANFYGMITNIDENVGRLRAKLKALSLEQNTIFIFMTDNGTGDGCVFDENSYAVQYYNAGMRGGKGSAYEGGHRVPFFLHYPNGGYSTGMDVSALSLNVDFMPTMINLCSLTLQQNLAPDGITLVPLMNGQELPERAAVTDSQRVPYPIKWKDSCVMRGKWRLINGAQLYDIEKDLEQKDDVCKMHPQLVEKMRQDYESWWDKVSVQFEHTIPISIGSNAETLTVLTSHDCRGSMAECAWNQGEVREGKRCNSYWEIFIEKSGRYRFELRRWPMQEDRAITEGIQGDIVNWYTGGVALPVALATLHVGEKIQSCAVIGGQKGSVFEVELKRGEVRLYAYFTDHDGKCTNAYYTYVSRLFDDGE